MIRILEAIIIDFRNIYRFDRLFRIRIEIDVIEVDEII